MDSYNGSDLSPHYVPPPPQSSSALLYPCSLDQFPETTETKRPGMEAQESRVGGVDEKKKRFSRDQLESLERSFQEEGKLEPDRKMKLSKEIGLQPRQIAVWFQNRRARSKVKQLQHLYDTLKQEFDAISMEKLDLQQQVRELRSMLREQAVRNHGSMAYMTVSEEEATESTAEGVRSCNNHIFNVESASSIPSLWSCSQAAHLPYYP
ncbi:putative homeobox-leucine zipper protein ATHB-51, partial [Cucurbita argyrosperma subsp. sororia]